MTYRYNFDYAPVPFLRLGVGDYELARKALDLLRNEIQVWNERALSHGALSAPYGDEMEDVEFIARQFAADELSGGGAMTGLAVGTLRYLKAGLVLLSARMEGEISDKANDGWPEMVVAYMREGLRKVNALSGMLEVAPADILNEITVGLGRRSTVNALEWDVFISYASEDREDFVRPLAELLRGEGLRVWYDEFVLKVGDRLNRSIDAGLARSRFGIVVLSPNFLANEWPQRELDGLVTREVNGTKVILPIWHKLQDEELRAQSPLLADRIAVKSSDGMDRVVQRLLEVIRPSSSA